MSTNVPSEHDVAPPHCAELRKECALSLTEFCAAQSHEDGAFDVGDGAKGIVRPERRWSGPLGAVRAHSAAIDAGRECGLENSRAMVVDMMQIDSPVTKPHSPSSPPTLRERAAADRERVDALADDIALCAARLHCVEHELLTNIRRFDELKGWVWQGSRSAAEWLSWRIGVGPVAAREKVRVAVALGSLPKIDAALRRGELSYCKVRAMTRVAIADNEELLLAQARGTTGAELERICSGFRKVLRGPVVDEEHRYVRRRFMQDGTVQIEMRLLPDEAERVWQALNEQRRALASRRAPSVDSEHDIDAETHTEHDIEHDIETESDSETDLENETECQVGGSENVSAETGNAPTMADAAVAISERALAGLGCRDASGADRRLLFVHLAEGLLRQSADTSATAETAETAECSPNGVASGALDEAPDPPWKAELQDGTAIHGESLLRLACDCGLVVAKTDAKGQVLDLGRRRRTVSVVLMRALRLRDRGCRFPGCNQRTFVDAHHIEHWAHGGATSLDNMTLLCGRHHLAVHEGGFGVTRGDDGGLLFFDPDGARVVQVPPMPRSPSSADVARRLAARGQRVHAGATRPQGRGWSVDLRGCVTALCGRRAAVEH